MRVAPKTIVGARVADPADFHGAPCRSEFIGGAFVEFPERIDDPSGSHFVDGAFVDFSDPLSTGVDGDEDGARRVAEPGRAGESIGGFDTHRDAWHAQRRLKLAAASIRFAVGAMGCAIFLTDRPGHLALAAADGDPGAPGCPDAIAEAAAKLSDRCIGGDRALTETRDDCAIVAAPTSHHRGARGAIALWRQSGAGDWSDDELAMVRSAADQVGHCLVDAVLSDRVHRPAERDELTRLYSRRTTMALIGERLRSRRQGTSALLCVDLNNFKICHDAFGHRWGNGVLADVADMIRAFTRSGDVAGRMGGAAFALWLDGASDERARSTARRLVELGQTLAPMSAAEDRPLGLAVGAAIYAHDADENITALVSRAIRTMHRAKQDAEARQVSGAFGLSSDARDGRTG